jgi:uncharacterized membrane protein
MNSKNYCLVSGILFAIVAIAHLMRIINGSNVLVDDYAVPMFVSWVGMIVPGVLALWAFRVAGR